VLGIEVDLEPIFAGVTGARDQAVNPADLAEGEMVIANRIERNRRETLKNFLRARALNCEL
jgi:hypothetical protein